MAGGIYIVSPLFTVSDLLMFLAVVSSLDFFGWFKLSTSYPHVNTLSKPTYWRHFQTLFLLDELLKKDSRSIVQTYSKDGVFVCTELKCGAQGFLRPKRRSPALRLGFALGVINSYLGATSHVERNGEEEGRHPLLSS
jgi:hypothetical protein